MTIPLKERPRNPWLVAAAVLIGIALLLLLGWPLFVFVVEKTLVKQLAASVSDATGLSTWVIYGVTFLVGLPALWAIDTLLSFRLFGWFRRRAAPRWAGRGLAKAILVVYAAGFCFVMYAATREGYFGHREGDVRKYYAVTPEGVRMFDAPGFDPKYGLELKPVTPQLVEQLARRDRQLGPRPLEAGDSREYFDPIDGSPRAWFSRDRSGWIRLYSAPGYDPETGVALEPVTVDLIGQLEAQLARGRQEERAERSRSAQAAVAEDRRTEQRKLFNLDGTHLTSPAVLAVGTGGEVLYDVGAMLAERLGGHTALFREAFTTDGHFLRAFSGDVSDLQRLLPAGIEAPIILVKVDVEVGGDWADANLTTARATLQTRRYRPQSDWLSDSTTATGEGVEFDPARARREALDEAIEQLLAELKRST